MNVQINVNSRATVMMWRSLTSEEITRRLLGNLIKNGAAFVEVEPGLFVYFVGK